jgi:phospholipid/cholesterol/gamma-HCH transport system permease protein
MSISSSQLGVSAYDYFSKAFAIISNRDVLGGLVKSLVFGYIIGLIGCYYGLKTEGGTQGVGTSTTRAVVAASVLIVFSDFVVTKLIWLYEFTFKSGAM